MKRLYSFITAANQVLLFLAALAALALLSVSGRSKPAS